MFSSHKGNIIFTIVVTIIIFGNLNSHTVNSVKSTEGLSNENKKVLFCYWGTWSHYRPEIGRFSVEDIDVNLCTHILYSFAGLSNRTNKIYTMDPWLDLQPGEFEEDPDDPENNEGGLNMIRRTVELRNKNPNLKIIMAIGGWTQGSERFSDMAKSPETREVFAESVKQFVRKFDLDGFDMDWEYPGNRGGAPEDRENFPLVLKLLREKLDELESEMGRRMILTSAFGCGFETMEKAYDLAAIVDHIDYFNLMLYDLKVYITDSEKPEDKLIGHHSPLYPKENEGVDDRNKTLDVIIKFYLDQGVPPEKILMGIGTYGKTFTLKSRAEHNFYDEAAGPGAAGPAIGENGTLGYFELCLLALNPTSRWEFYTDPDYKVPYAFNDNLWVGYDNELSTQIKVDYALNLGLGGFLVWSLEMDDFKNYCQGWNNSPIISAIKDRIDHYDTNYK